MPETRRANAPRCLKAENCPIESLESADYARIVCRRYKPVNSFVPDLLLFAESWIELSARTPYLFLTQRRLTSNSRKNICSRCMSTIQSSPVPS